MKLIAYGNLELVMKSWDSARYSGKEFDTKFGEVVLKRLFEIEPKARTTFADKTVKDKMHGRSFNSFDMHSKMFASLFDSIFQMLGPDIEFTEEILRQVGLRHKSVGVDGRFFPAMGDAFLYGIEQFVPHTLSAEERCAWKYVYDAISSDIVLAIKS